MAKTIKIKNTLPHLIDALWHHDDCPKWLQDIIWDGIENRRDGRADFAASFWASQLANATPDVPGESELDALDAALLSGGDR